MRQRREMGTAAVWLKSSLLAGCSVVIGVVLSGCAPSAPKPNIEHMLATATTPADHLNIAEYYSEEAAEDEAKYREHEADAERYEHSPKFGRAWAEHCAQLAQDYKQAARDASVLAAEHRKVADEISAGSEGVPSGTTPSAK